MSLALYPSRVRSSDLLGGGGSSIARGWFYSGRRQLPVRALTFLVVEQVVSRDAMAAKFQRNPYFVRRWVQVAVGILSSRCAFELAAGMYLRKVGSHNFFAWAGAPSENNDARERE